mmetsp:Transcript_71241/g.117155  ORF Transcript_71241/g.117155 Transcript_71241/m.117155 type:complete len:91 (+) Transcript_71241:374-646(+)
MTCLSCNGHGGKLHGCSRRSQLLVDGPYGSRIDPRSDATSLSRFSAPQGFSLRPERLPVNCQAGGSPAKLRASPMRWYSVLVRLRAKSLK